MGQIVGLGQDLVDIRRIKGLLDRSPRFASRIATQLEISKLPNNPAARVRSIAKLFAAKEACLKAIGTGMREGISWYDLEILRNDLGAPIVKYSQNLQLIINKMHNDAFYSALKDYARDSEISINAKFVKIPKFFLTISDEPPYAMASAVLTL